MLIFTGADKQILSSNGANQPTVSQRLPYLSPRNTFPTNPLISKRASKSGNKLNSF